MRSFIASCCLAGIGEWVLPPDMEESVFRTQIDHIPGTCRWSIAPHEEAACFAMGRLMASGQPVALIVKPGEESREYLAGILRDAGDHGYPLVLITTGTSCKLSEACLSIVIEKESECDGTLFNKWNYREPFHIHLADHLEHRSEPDNTAATDLAVEPAPAPSFPRPALGELARTLRFHNYEGLLLMLGCLEPDEQEPALWLAEGLKCPVTADASSGLREELSALRLRDEETVMKSDLPGTVLRIGSVPSSPFWKDLDQHPEIKVFSITRSSRSGLARNSQLITAQMEEVAKAIGDIKPIGDPCDLMHLSRKRQGLIEELLMSHTESAQAFLYDISHFASIADYIHIGGPCLANSWNMAAQNHVPTSFLRTSPGSYGLSGHLACFMGASCGLGESWCLLDDLTDAQGMEDFPLIAPPDSAKRVIVAIANRQQDDTALQNAVTRLGGLYMRLTSSFDLKSLDELTDEGLYFIRIIPDSRQTDDFNTKLQS